jgi:hypothetical protein
MSRRMGWGTPKEVHPWSRSRWFLGYKHYKT